jgi:hypothetical protein
MDLFSAGAAHVFDMDMQETSMAPGEKSVRGQKVSSEEGRTKA